MFCNVPGVEAADLFSKSVPGHFLIYFQAIPASQQNILSLAMR